MTVVSQWLETWLVLTLGDLPRLLTISALFLVFGTLEILLPAERGHTWGGRLRNVSFTLILVIFGIALTSIVVMVFDLSPRRYEPGGPLQTGLVVVAHLAVFDLLFYWYHRAQHSWRWFWPVHELHHADAELNVTTGMRSYFLEYPLQTLLITMPTAWVVGIDPGASLIIPVVMVTWLYFAHANLRLHLGSFSPVVCGPQVHRIHHSREKLHRDKNFAQFFPIYDVIFGTWYAPAREEFPRTGTVTMASDAPVGEVVGRPLRVWGRAVAARLAGWRRQG